MFSPLFGVGKTWQERWIALRRSWLPLSLEMCFRNTVRFTIQIQKLTTCVVAVLLDLWNFKDTVGCLPSNDFLWRMDTACELNQIQPFYSSWHVARMAVSAVCDACFKDEARPLESNFWHESSHRSIPRLRGE